MLNASRHHRPGSPPWGVEDPSRDLGCSTPRGITAPGHGSSSSRSRPLARCSTPRGITAPGHAQRASARGRFSRGAQRLAASPPRVTLARAEHSRAPLSLCSTPRGITAPGHEDVRAIEDGTVGCSTPRGITAPGHRATPRLLSVRPVCSTPRGITAPGHTAPPARRRGSGRAQRLAASPPRVTPASPLRLPATDSAQRLAASPPRVTPPPSASAGWSRWCAQRLAASPPRVTLKRDARASNGCGVLNASRHHRPGSPIDVAYSLRCYGLCSTPRGITAPGHPRVVARRSRAKSCSTPRGITAPGHHRVGVVDGGHAAVLNASRHHRPGSHPQRKPSVSAETLCSTPRGITAPGHVLPELVPRGALLCSTPRGITAPGHPMRLVEDLRRHGCSTPRGITAPGHARAEHSRAPLSLCSTPRGITAPGHLRHADPPRRALPVLNASRHHRPGSPSARRGTAAPAA